MTTEHDLTAERDAVTYEDRETTHGMVGHYLSMLADEPPQDAGGHPSYDVHVQAGAEWAEWDRQRRAWLTLLAPRLLREAVDDFKGGPTARGLTTPPAKHPNWPCATDGCPGDGRYAPPGRGHVEGCTGPIYPPAGSEVRDA